MALVLNYAANVMARRHARVCLHSLVPPPEFLKATIAGPSLINRLTCKTTSNGFSATNVELVKCRFQGHSGSAEFVHGSKDEIDSETFLFLSFCSL